MRASALLHVRACVELSTCVCMCVCVLPQNLALIVLGVGAVFSVIFHLGTTESGRTKERVRPKAEEVEEEDEEQGASRPLLPKPRTQLLLLQWKCWLRQPSFYQVREESRSSFLEGVVVLTAGLALGCRWPSSTCPPG